MSVASTDTWLRLQAGVLASAHSSAAFADIGRQCIRSERIEVFTYSPAVATCSRALQQGTLLQGTLYSMPGPSCTACSIWGVAPLHRRGWQAPHIGVGTVATLGPPSASWPPALLLQLSTP
jgi:hypothetical protein